MTFRLHAPLGKIQDSHQFCQVVTRIGHPATEGPFGPAGKDLWPLVPAHCLRDHGRK